MKIRAVIFDIYKTLLDLGPSPLDAEARWVALWLETFGGPPRFDLAGFRAACDGIIAREQAAARAAGIAWPEVCWPDVVAAVLPELARTPARSPATFMLRHAGLMHTVRLHPVAAHLLASLRDHGALLGLVSNCQPYTLAELEAEFATAGLSLDIFHPSLRFLSFEHGYSKPDPHVFRLLSARLRLLGVAAPEAWVVGDRLDNDIEPARAQGFQTWQLDADSSLEPMAGGWEALAKHWQRGQ
jgi:FMN phosphatase YigB (HAD superfamily)